MTTEQRELLLTYLPRFIPGVTVWAYGSRVKRSAKDRSDLDLVVFATPQQQSAVCDLQEALDESNLPFLVDLHIWDDLPERFHETILQHHAVIQEGTWHHI